MQKQKISKLLSLASWLLQYCLCLWALLPMLRRLISTVLQRLALISGASTLKKIAFKRSTARHGESLTLDTATTTANFKVKLNKPGDYYAFSVDVINDGTFDAILKSITMTQLTEAEAKLLKFSVSYDGTEYTSSATNLTDTLNYNTGNNTKNVIVRVEYRKDIAAEDLPAADAEVSLSVALGYEQG